MIAMIVMIFVDIMSITSLVCVTAMLMITVLVFSNHWRGISIWGLLASSEFAAVPLTAQDRLDDLNEFFEELFSSIDYSILLIFLGTFVVIANIESTGIPKRLWDKIVGEVPFSTVGSVFGISLFVMISSQLLGNVAIVQLSRPNVDSLDDDSRAYAWAVISFVSTIAGNLTITGSAANIIVAEKAARIDPEANINFFQHYRVCFWVTAVSCAIGASLITAISKIH
jgi:Na+/H+ antiporter NhaD/arsenite permease-like protein